MVNDHTQRMLNDIGQRLSEEIDHASDRALLYAQVETMMVGLCIFIERGNNIEYFDGSDSLAYLLLDLWEEEEEDPAKRWAEMEYVLRDGAFSVMFVYPGQFDPEEDFFERRKRVVARYFGEKPILYPPLLKSDGQRFDL